MSYTIRDSARAFDAAIEAGYLNTNQNSVRCVSNYMYMHTDASGADKPQRKGSKCPFCNHFTRGDLYGNGALKRLGIHIRTDHADKLHSLGGAR